MTSFRPRSTIGSWRQVYVRRTTISSQLWSCTWGTECSGNKDDWIKHFEFYVVYLLVFVEGSKHEQISRVKRVEDEIVLEWSLWYDPIALRFLREVIRQYTSTNLIKFDVSEISGSEGNRYRWEVCAMFQKNKKKRKGISQRVAGARWLDDEVRGAC